MQNARLAFHADFPTIKAQKAEFADTDFGVAFFPLVVTPVPNQSDSVSILMHALKLYASQNVEFSVSRAPASNGLSFCFFSVSGYLIDL